MNAFLGEFEHMVLVAALRLGPDAYGAAIAAEIERESGRRVPTGAVYVTVERLERKGYVTTHLGESDAHRGGRPKRFVTPSAEGIAAARAARDAMLRLWSGVEPDSGAS